VQRTAIPAATRPISSDADRAVRHVSVVSVRASAFDGAVLAGLMSAAALFQYEPSLPGTPAERRVGATYV
jgi:hypothetical protein